jgi:hypothetical protein
VVFEGPLAFDGSQWHTLLPDLPAGTYRLRIEARGDGPERSFSTRTALAVLDPAEEAIALGGESVTADDLNDTEILDDSEPPPSERSMVAP